MEDVTAQFHDELRQVNDKILIGKYYSPGNQLLSLVPINISFLHSDPSRSAVFLPYVLKKIGQESAYVEYQE